MWRPRDRERFIGSYDPEREMPDPDRERGDRWQSDAYRHNARDTRFAYRMNPDRFERPFEGRRDFDRERDLRWEGDARDFGRMDYDRGRYSSPYGGYRGDFNRECNRDFNRDYSRDYNREYNRGDYDPGFGRDYGRGGFMIGSQYDRDRHYGSDRGWDYDRNDRGFNESQRYERDRSGGWDWDRERNWRRR